MLYLEWVAFFFFKPHDYHISYSWNYHGTEIILIAQNFDHNLFTTPVSLKCSELESLNNFDNECVA